MLLLVSAVFAASAAFPVLPVPGAGSDAPDLCFTLVNTPTNTNIYLM
jgi:hypothetical protein